MAAGREQQYASAQAVRDEALRSASFGAMTLMHAARRWAWRPVPDRLDVEGVA
jgi:hypothetical protein